MPPDLPTIFKALADLTDAAEAAWHQINSAGLNPEQYKALNKMWAAAQMGNRVLTREASHTEDGKGPCDDDCHIADHNALMDQVRAVVATWQAT